jgi:ribosomal protein L16 Arg81 hydroxylase
MQIKAVPRVAQIDEKSFLKTYKTQNQPVIIENLSRQWPAHGKWTVDYLCSVVGDKQVPLYGGQEAKGHKHQHAHVEQMTFRQFIQTLEQGNNKLRMFFYNILQQAPALMKDFSFPKIGLHLFKKLPVLFFGGKGAKVQMHFDIDWADLLLCHFGGKKRVYLFGPEQSKFLYHVPYSFSAIFEVDIDQPDYQRFPALQNAHGFMAELAHGDVLYIPPGFWHYVVYDEMCFSMTLRAFPRTPAHLARLAYNILYVRTVDGLMRRWVGQSWNEKNRVRAFERSNSYAPKE